MTGGLLFGELSADDCLCGSARADESGDHERPHPDCPIHAPALEPKYVEQARPHCFDKIHYLADRVRRRAA